VPVGSTVSTTGNVSITTTGAGGQQLPVAGSAIEGENVSFTADNDVTLASAVGSSHSASSNWCRLSLSLVMRMSRACLAQSYSGSVSKDA